MIHIEYSTPFKGKVRTLTLIGSPGIGVYKDIYGRKWDVHDFIGKSYTRSNKNIVHARLIDNSNKYSTESDSFLKGYRISYNPFFVKYSRKIKES